MLKNLFLRKIHLILLCTVIHTVATSAPVSTKYLSGTAQYVCYSGGPDDFSLSAGGKSAPICVSPSDHRGVARAAADLAEDVGRVTGMTAQTITTDSPVKGSVIIGTIGKSRMIDSLAASGKLNVKGIKGRWESFVIEIIDGNLVVAGSDKRGTIYGIYDISEKIGVSPWYWWADVPPRKSTTLYIKAGRYVQPSPKVKYRGIFINDEWPSFGGWAEARFGGINSKMYAHIFELLLRLKANFLWPAMWDSAFNEDDPESPRLADMYGIVMGTSHHEPMMRAHKEYTRRRKLIGAWDYRTNKNNLDSFFRHGLTRNKAYENMITIGMRGDGDVAMGNGDDEENMKTLHDVISGQRRIISDVYGRPATEVPQLWAIFTEVQRYYDKGFNVPDDVMLLFCDNNWGYIRRTGPEKERNRKGGMGLYYHIDMNGGPWNDRWVTTTTVPKLREQLNLAYRTGIDDLWIINVGDLKPKEFPIDFIMRYAWNPDTITAADTYGYTLAWAAQNFGDAHAEAVADIISRYTKYNLWRKAETQRTGLFSIVNHREADRLDSLWQDVADRAENLRRKMPEECHDAFFELVYYPAVASAAVAQIYTAATRNNLYAAQGRLLANRYKQVAEALFDKDRRLTAYYNDTLAQGKWKNMMSDRHIGYTRWSMPEQDSLPRLLTVTPADTPSMGINAEGNETAEATATLPTFDSLLDQTYYIDIFNRGKGSLKYTATADKTWVKLSKTAGNVTDEERITVSIDWAAADYGNNTATINITDGHTTGTITVNAVKGRMPATDRPFYGNWSGAEFQMPACGFAENVSSPTAAWTQLPDLGRGEACMGSNDVTISGITPPEGPHLEYDVLLADSGTVTVCIGILPVQDVNPVRGLRLAASLDDAKPVTIDARQGIIDIFQEYTQENLSLSKNLKPLPHPETEVKLTGYGERMRSDVFDNIRWLTVRLNAGRSGLHRLKIYMIDPEIVLERIVINPDNSHPSYFGAPVKAIIPDQRQ